MKPGFKTALQKIVSFEHEKGKKNNLIFLNNIICMETFQKEKSFV